MPDISMSLARLTGVSFGLQPMIPLSLQGRTLRETTTKRASLIDAVGNALTTELTGVITQFPQGTATLEAWIISLVPKVASRIVSNNELAETTRTLLPDVPDLMARLNVALRTWAGYMDAAKAIDAKTADGPNTPKTREDNFNFTIHPTAEQDPLYAAGVVAAPSLKHRIKGEDIFSDGIPSRSIVLLDWDD